MNGVATCECTPQFEGNFCNIDKCAKCDSHARCDNGNCVCMEGWVGDGQTCTPKGGPPGSGSLSGISPPGAPPSSPIPNSPPSSQGGHGLPGSYGPPGS